MRPSLTLVVVAAVVVACAACVEEGSREPAGVTTADSAGVTIVTSTAEAIEHAGSWTLPGPLFDVGAGADGAIVLFGVADVTPLVGGRVAVANGNPAQVLVFEADGALVTALGREGEGPGEFARVTSIVPLGGDSLAVWDGWRLRLSVFTVSSGFAREVDLREVVPSTSDGWTRMLATRSGELVAFTEAGLARRHGVYRMEAPSHVIAPGGEMLHTLGPFKGAELFGSDIGNGAVFFGAHTNAATAGNGLVVGTQDAAEVRVFDLEGRLRRIVRWPEGDRKVEGPLLRQYETWIAQQIEAAPDERREWMRKMSEAIPMAERLPAYGDVLGADDGTVWVGAYPGHVAAAGQVRMPERTWLVFDADGAIEAMVRTPEGFRALAVRGERVWGVYEDELDVESVRAYRIERGEE